MFVGRDDPPHPFSRPLPSLLTPCLWQNLVTPRRNKTLEDVRKERSQVESELLNIIEERETLLQRLHKVQTLIGVAILPPQNPTDKIRMLRAPTLTPPTAGVYRKVDEMEKSRFVLEEVQSAQRSSSTSDTSVHSRSASSDTYMNLQQQYTGEGLGNLANGAQSQLAAGLEKLWSSDKAAAERYARVMFCARDVLAPLTLSLQFGSVKQDSRASGAHDGAAPAQQRQRLERSELERGDY